MKRKTRIFLTVCLSLICALCLFACGGKKDKSSLACTIVESAEKRVVISVSQTDGVCTLIDCMEALKAQDDSFTYEISGGMIMSINGLANAADWSEYWILYSSDAEMTTMEKTTEYNGKKVGSTIVGAESLTVLAGEVYVWEYGSF